MTKSIPVKGLYNFKATVAYRGTGYKGWQIQQGLHGQPSIQGTLENALTQLKSEPADILSIQGAGRTDAGVHARGQVFNFYSQTLSPPPERLPRAVNSFLPEDIRVLAVERVPMDFHARYSALSKTYSFHIHQGKIADPLLSGLSQHLFQKLDVSVMQTAAKALEGTHDFTQFSSKGHADLGIPGLKTLTAARVHCMPDGLRMVFTGSGFLYNQCRHMAGCLIRVGMGALSVEDVQDLLRAGRHSGLKHRAWTLAMACGLYLEEVKYPPFPDCDSLLCPEAPHDAFGRIDFEGIAPVERATVADILRQKKAAAFMNLCKMEQSCLQG